MSDFDVAHQACTQALAGPEATIPRLLRKNLLASLGPMVVQRGNRAEVTPGLMRRLRLQVLSALKVLPAWDAIVKTDDPRKLLEVIDAYMARRVSWEAAWREQNEFGGALLNVTSVPEDEIYVIYAGYATTYAVLTALMDSSLKPDGIEDQETDAWDGALYACGAYAREMPWMPKSDRARRVEFWTWWLEQAGRLVRVPDDATWPAVREVGAVD